MIGEEDWVGESSKRTRWLEINNRPNPAIS
jgi:hypothetical protein